MELHKDEEDYQPGDYEEEPYVQPKYLKFTEKDYTIRKPSPKYELFKSIETQCLSINHP